MYHISNGESYRLHHCIVLCVHMKQKIWIASTCMRCSVICRGRRLSQYGPASGLMPLLLRTEGADAVRDERQAEAQGGGGKGGGQRKLARVRTDPANPTDKKTAAGLQGDHKKLMTTMLKFTLQLGQSRRNVEGVLFDIILVRADSQEVIGMQDQTHTYGQKVKELGKGHGLGSPHVYAWMGLIAALNKRTGGITAEAAKALKEYADKLAQQTVTLLHDECRFCRVDKVYNPQLKRITLSVEATGMRRAVVTALTDVGGAVKQGRAPASYMERELQEWLEAVLA